MKAANPERAIVRSGSHFWPNVFDLPINRFAPASGSSIYSCSTFRVQLLWAMVSLLTGLIALWLTLTILSLIGLWNVDSAFPPSASARIADACALALALCIIGFPLFAPWLLAFLPAYCLVPSNTLLWKPWICTVSGILVGVLALWIDAVFYDEFTGGPLSSLNFPLLVLASIPAAVLGGAIGFAAAEGKRVLKRGFDKAGASR